MAILFGTDVAHKLNVTEQILSVSYQKEVVVIRLTVIAQNNKEVVLKVEGWVSGDAVDLLAAEGDRQLQQTERLVLDLAGVRFIDDAGIRLLRRWSGERLELRGGSPFVQVLLEAHGLV
ncbi:MAG: STAS domain-containing protein [Candidatus Latescibacteria bacterium]|nr:STAS domain-containing protein [Candidatus Latescibacterota bacterium]